MVFLVYEEDMKKRIFIFIVMTAYVLNSCSLIATPPAEEKVSIPSDLESTESPASEAPAAETIIPESKAGDGGASESNLAGEAEIVIATVESPAINPLSGLPVSNPENLLLPPALVSVTNFPPTARPQAGLSFSPVVFELYIGDGMTRYLAIFYGDYPQSAVRQASDELSEGLGEGLPEAAIGPVRSGRIPYEHIRKLFNGFIVMASAYSRVADQLSDYVNVFGDDHSDVNSAMISVEAIEAIAKETEKELGDSALSGMAFDSAAPEGGKDALSLWLYYSFKNQVFWRFNSEDGSYHRWQDNADGVTFIEQTDRLTGETLAFENVIVLLVDHEVEQKYFIDLDLLYVNRGSALVFRDGEMHEVYWTTRSEEYEQTTGKLRPIRFVDAEGNPFPLKPGQTWIELIPTYSPVWETVDSEKYHLLLNGRSKGSGYWAVWFAVDN